MEGNKIIIADYNLAQEELSRDEDPRVRVAFCCSDNAFISSFVEAIFSHLVNVNLQNDKVQTISCMSFSSKYFERVNEKVIEYCAKNNLPCKKAASEFKREDYNSYDFIIACDDQSFYDLTLDSPLVKVAEIIRLSDVAGAKTITNFGKNMPSLKDFNELDILKTFLHCSSLANDFLNFICAQMENYYKSLADSEYMIEEEEEIEEIEEIDVIEDENEDENEYSSEKYYIFHRFNPHQEMHEVFFNKFSPKLSNKVKNTSCTQAITLAGIQLIPADSAQLFFEDSEEEDDDDEETTSQTNNSTESNTISSNSTPKSNILTMIRPDGCPVFVVYDENILNAKESEFHLVEKMTIQEIEALDVEESTKNETFYKLLSFSTKPKIVNVYDMTDVEMIDV